LTALAELQQRELTKIRFIAIAIGVIAPAIYLIVAQFVSPAEAGGEVLLMFYILLIMAAMQPMAAPLIARFQMAAYRRQMNSVMTPAQLYTQLTIIKLAFAEASFIYGLVVLLLGGGVTRMLYFYPIGAIWMFVFWPRRERMEQFIQKVTAP